MGKTCDLTHLHTPFLKHMCGVSHSQKIKTVVEICMEYVMLYCTFIENKVQQSSLPRLKIYFRIILIECFQTNWLKTCYLPTKYFLEKVFFSFVINLLTELNKLLTPVNANSGTVHEFKYSKHFLNIKLIQAWMGKACDLTCLHTSYKRDTCGMSRS